jgi:hypothetical protein
MTTREIMTKQFNSYQIHYAISKARGKDYVRIDFFNWGTKVGQILMGDSISPGSYAGIHDDEIHLYFPLSHFANISKILQQEFRLALYVQLEPCMTEESQPAEIRRGGIVTNQ